MNNIIKRISVIFLMICILIPQQTIILFAEVPDGADASKEQTVEQQAATEEQDQTATDAAAGSSAQDEDAKADKADNATADTKQEAAPAAKTEEKDEAAEPQPEEKAEPAAKTETEDKVEPEAEVKMPAGSEKASTSEMDVNVSWDEGIFPEGVSMKVRKASKQEAMDAAQEMADEDTKIVDAIAVDISFYAADGTEVQPVSPEGVHVTLKAKRAVEGETHQVVHIDDKGIAEEVADADASAKKASFDSVGFSIYAIVGEDGKTSDEEEVRRTYIFYYPGENGNPDYDTSQPANLVEWDKQIVKNGDILVEPGTPSLKDQPDSFFAGWYAEGSDTRMTFGSEVNDIPTAAGSEDETVNVYAKYSTKYAAIFRDDEGNIEHEVVGEAGDEISLNVEIPGIEDRGSRLTGWKLVETGTSYNLDDTYTFNITDKNVEFEPVIQTVRKIQFNANHEDASFTAPVYAAVGEVIPAVDDPTNTGYTFTGWYLDAECTQEFDIETGTVPAGDDAFKLYAGWDPEQVNFQVYVWGEVMDSNGDPIPEGGDGRYAVKAEWTNQIEAGYKFTADEVMAEYQRGISDPANLI
ncbi:MAG: InlB B-repeat-containing protein, partial [Mogibacterium sp.]|nr:InlB B-repeat-containing protein [Mogibacterium sp.]